MSRVPRPGAGPTVVFLQDQPRQSMLQLSAALRRHGVRTLRVGDVRSRDERLMTRWVFDATITLHDFLDAGFLDPRIADLQCSEVDVALLAPLVADLRTPPVLAATLSHRLAHRDKLVVSTLLRAAGVPVPDTWPADDLGAALAVSGLPVVVKRRVGAGGSGVLVARDEDEVRAALGRWGPDVFLERYEAGPTHQYGAVHVGGEVVADVASRSVSVRGTHGPAARVVVDQDRRVLEVGRCATGALGGTGLVNLDLQMGPHGPLVVDVNLRAWDSLVPLRGDGVDLVAPYVETLGTAHRRSPYRRSPYRRTRSRYAGSFPADVQGAVLAHRPLAALGRATVGVPRYLVWLGPGYVAHALWLVALEWRGARRPGRRSGEVSPETGGDGLACARRR